MHSTVGAGPTLPQVHLWDLRSSAAPRATSIPDGSAVLGIKASPLGDCVAGGYGQYCGELLMWQGRCMGGGRGRWVARIGVGGWASRPACSVSAWQVGGGEQKGLGGEGRWDVRVGVGIEANPLLRQPRGRWVTGEERSRCLLHLEQECDVPWCTCDAF